MIVNVPKELVDRFEKNSGTYQKNLLAIWVDFLGSETMKQLARDVGIKCGKRYSKHIFKLIAGISNEPGQKDELK